MIAESKTPDAATMPAGRGTGHLSGRTGAFRALLNGVPEGVRSAFSRPLVVATGYLLCLTVAELVSTVAEPRAGLLLHALLLVALLYHSSRSLGKPLHKLMLALAFAPLIRLLSYALPLAALPRIYWYAATSLPLFVAAAVTAPGLGYRRRALGLRLGWLPVQLLVALSGFVFGYVEYQILAPTPLARSLTWQDIMLPAFILLVGTGFFEELLFRGLLQCAAVETLGRYGVAFGAVVFAVLHIGYKSLVDVFFVLVVGLFFGWVVARTKSLFGVTLAHGLTNIMLFLVMPFMAVSAPAQIRERLPGAPVVTRAAAAVIQFSATAGKVTPEPAPDGTKVPGAIVATARPTSEPAAMPAPAVPTPEPPALTVPPAPAPEALATASPAAYAPPEPAGAHSGVRGTVKVDAAMLRRGPGTAHPVLGLVFDGASYEILGRSPAGDWWLIAVDAQTTGWVSGSLLTTTGDLSTVVVVARE